MDSIDVVALGELLIDFTENGLSANGNPLLEANPGGAPCNVLAMLNKFGHSTEFIGKVGDDNFGHMLAQTLTELGIGTSGLLFDKEVPTTLAFVHTKEDGDRSFSFYRSPGADVMLNEADVKLELIDKAKIFHFGTLSMTDEGVELATKKAIKRAEEKGKLLSFDPNLRPPLWTSLDKAKEKMSFGMEHCDILKISDDEIEFFTGEKDIDKGIAIIRSRYDIRLICATLGKKGSIAYYDGLRVVGEPYPNPNTIETTGAGDTFMGVILHNILEVGLDALTEERLKKMLLTANCAASIITGRKGALRVMPDPSEFCNL